MLDEHQVAHGYERLEELSEKLNLPKDDVIRVLQNRKHISEFYNWVNASDFVTFFEDYIKYEPYYVKKDT